MWRRLVRMLSRDDGMVTAETAVVLPVLLLVLAGAVAAVVVVGAHLRVVDAAREGTRAAARGEDVAAVRTRLANEYTYNVASPFLAAERGELDGVIEPAATRVAVIKALRALRTKRAEQPPKKHGNIPL